MLKKLLIQNYALLSSAEFLPGEGLNIITGETGAGKSIMLGALGLLLGNRADSKVLFNEEEKCIVEGTFIIGSYHLQSLFEANDLDYDTQCIIRREVSPAGKSRAFVNDTPVTLETLKEIGLRIMDIHSQHETLELGNNQFQLKVLDAFSETRDLLLIYIGVYQEYKLLNKQLEELKEKTARLKQEHDYNEYLLKELHEGQFDNTEEQEELESELRLLENAEEIKLRLLQVTQMLSNEEQGTLQALKAAVVLLNQAGKLANPVLDLAQRLESTRIELKDISDELDELQNKTEHNPERIVLVKGRLDLLYRLQQKHQVNTIASLVAIQADLEKKVNDTLTYQEEIISIEKRLEKINKQLESAASKLSAKRKQSAPALEKLLKELLAEVGMPNAEVKIEIQETTPTISGTDSVKLLFSANKGVAPQDISKAASGGEFSRLMLCIKYILAERTALPTIIFDEIDSGISGEIAMKVGKLMKRMSEGHQLITITHLPQMAAKADTHFYVYKDDKGTRTSSHIRMLTSDERVSEIAKMIGGDQPSATAYQSAKELIQG